MHRREVYLVISSELSTVQRYMLYMDECYRLPPRSRVWRVS